MCVCVCVFCWQLRSQLLKMAREKSLALEQMEAEVVHNKYNYMCFIVCHVSCVVCVCSVKHVWRSSRNCWRRD